MPERANNHVVLVDTASCPLRGRGLTRFVHRVEPHRSFTSSANVRGWVA